MVAVCYCGCAVSWLPAAEEGRFAAVYSRSGFLVAGRQARRHGGSQQ